MQICIDIDEKDLNEAVLRGIKELSDECLSEIAVLAIENYLSKPDVLNRLIFKEERNYYGYQKTPNDWFVDLIKNSFSPDEVKKYRELIFNTLEESRKDILIETFAKSFAHSLLDNDTQTQLAMVIGDYMKRPKN